jgi:hypothetical protein
MHLRFWAPALVALVMWNGQSAPRPGDYPDIFHDPEWVRDQERLRYGPPPDIFQLPPTNGGVVPNGTLQISVMPSDDVIPVAGDSAGPVDEVMAPPDGYRPIAFTAPAAFAPFIVGVMRENSRVDFRVLSPHGLSSAQWRAAASRPLVIQPLSSEGAANLERAMAPLVQRGSGTHVAKLQGRVYCADVRRKVPPEGTVFVVADRAAQALFEPARYALRVARQAARKNVLATQGDPAAYADSITQYAIWTRLEHWNETRFIDEFVKRTKEAFAGRKQAWTADSADIARIAARYRWADVDRILTTADEIEQRLKTAATTGGAR